MKRSLVLIASVVALFFVTLAPSKASAGGGISIYVEPGYGYGYTYPRYGYGYGYPRYSYGYYPSYGYYYPRGYYVYRAPRRYVRRRARSYWRGW